MIRGSSFDDPAVKAGFAAAYDGDPWQQEPAGSEPSSDPAAGESAEPSPVAGLRRPPMRRHRAPAPVGVSPARAVAGAAVSVGGVALGILSLLWVTGDPPAPADVAARTAAPVTQTAPLESEQAPVTPAPPETALPMPVAVPPEGAAPVPAAVPPAPPVVPVTVLNNSRTAGLAGRTAETFREGGWPVAETGNFTGRIRATTVYYAPGQEESARALVTRFPRIERILPRFEGLPGSGLTVVLTRDFA